MLIKVSIPYRYGITCELLFKDPVESVFLFQFLIGTVLRKNA